MNVLEVVILGALQGLTEFLPVSSSGHLELAKSILGDPSIPEESLAFTVILHFATASSTLVIFRRELLNIIKGLFQFQWNEETQFSFKIIVSMIPAVFVGLYFEQEITSLFNSQLLLVGSMLLATALLLLLADKAKETRKKMGFLDAVIVGFSQAIAILPGISRSGATIATAVLLGVDRTKAAKFSFLMVVPLIVGKIINDLSTGEIHFSSEKGLPMIIGFLTAFITGLAACKWMIALVKKSSLRYFSLYCAIVGVISIILAMS